MKKLILSLVVALALVMAFGSSVLAADPTTTTITWSGGGVIGGVVTSGNDNTASFGVNAALANGSFTVTDNNDNPYGYNVDTVSSYIQSAVTNGSTFYQVVRTDSYSSYSHAGQVDYAYVGSSGTAEMATGSNTNYAAMVNCTYAQPQTSGSWNFQANGSTYTIQQFIAANATLTGGVWTPTDNYAVVTATGNGTAGIDCMTTETSGCWPTKLGAGGGCYTDADVTLTGSGTFAVNAGGCNSITVPSGGGMVITGNGTFGSASYSVIANFVGGTLVVPDYSVKVQ